MSQQKPRARKSKALAVATPKVSLGVALIAKDAEHTLGACLETLRPYVEQIVVCVDERTTDATARVAKKYGAITHPVAVSDWHECERHGRVLAQHFANARNESFKHLDPSLDWWMWIDADDVFVGGDQLMDILPNLDPQFIGVWLPYDYSTIHGQPNTQFHRERILRPRAGWRWEYRVHEVVKPINDGPWFTTPRMRMVHQDSAHKSESSASRNLLLLEIDLESEPDDPRTIFYIGNQHFALGQWEPAIEWYERLLALRHDNQYERWQSAIYLSMAYERVGNLAAATQAAYCALDDVPQHPEPYFRLASIANRAGRFEHAIWWTNLGRQGTEPPFFVFKNPLDYSFNNRTVMGEALAQMADKSGDLRFLAKGTEEWQQAYDVLPDPTIGDAIQRASKIQEFGAQAQEFVQTLQSIERYALPGADNGMVESMYGQLPEEVKAFPVVRNVAIPRILAHRPTTQPRLVFWCGPSWEPWHPGSIDEGGIGGSETAVIQIARRFASDGWRVDVYNDPGRYEGVYGDVGYWQCERYVSQPAELFVAWRQPRFPVQIDFGTKTVLWCHDLNYGPLPPDELLVYERVLGVSAWHANMLRRYYDLSAEQVGWVPNGIEPERFSHRVDRVPMRCVYASSADRGLLRLLALWPQVRGAEPGAELHVAYGWQTIDRMVAAGRTDLAAFKAHTERVIAQTEGVVWHGRLPQDKLAELYGSAYAWTYPTSFLEVSCISAMEAMTGGAVPVSTACGALSETVGDAGILIPGPAESRPYASTFVNSVLALMTDPQIRSPLMYRAQARATELTWDKSYEEHWKPLIEEMLGGDAHAEPTVVHMNEGAAV